MNTMYGLCRGLATSAGLLVPVFVAAGFQTDDWTRLGIAIGVVLVAALLYGRRGDAVRLPLRRSFVARLRRAGAGVPLGVLTPRLIAEEVAPRTARQQLPPLRHFEGGGPALAPRPPTILAGTSNTARPTPFTYRAGCSGARSWIPVSPDSPHQDQAADHWV